MKRTHFSAEEALTYLEANQERFPLQMVTRLSAVELGATVFPVDLSEVTEARYFGPEGELRFFDDGGLVAVLVEDEPGDVYIDRTANLLPKFGKRLTKRQYVAFDWDGQGYIRIIRLLDWEGGNDHAGE